ncbi:MULTISPECIES: TetR/AcrR family transcriptional regulator [Moorena]|uniref:Transcriptional regulator n=1 Tax=Moorena producens 3L TaxID=489825 RepID=F4XL19_9CYAN|nr:MULTISPECIES: TetR/AcrR family transcriptional regulator [Moorena]EGJ34709.1 transcriptional regulator [Moorena producens 3L]NEP68714.1 TetR family transcriptional regulator [Moorena sp. SIO3A5]NEQ14010.1 TetR family transcriptional regulator [Moorena sp. SIO3E2]OLT66243.1 TetR family transcriptional regulator [Moorena producens 3L]
MSQQDRRLEVSEAAWRVIVREGLDRTSMRAIAQELGCTTGVVTHHFRDKQELILFALNQVTQRLQKTMQAATEHARGVDRLVEMLSAFLPLDTERQDILKVWVAFLGYAIGRESLMAEHQHSAAQLRQVIIQELKALQSAKLIRPNIEPELEANALLALVNGVSLDSLIQAKRLSPDQQQIVIRRYVNELLSTHAMPDSGNP